MSEGKELIEAHCPVCGYGHARVLKNYRNHSPIFAGKSIVECVHCGMIFVDPMPDEQALAAYNASYFDNAHDGISSDTTTVAFHSGINLLRVQHVEAYCSRNRIQVREVLEIGPGTGHFASHWLTRNPGTKKYAAVESDAACYDRLRKTGVDVYGSVEAIATDYHFDLVVISHVLEHTSHPATFIRACTRLLRPGGVLFIEVPCRDHEHKAAVEPHTLFFDKGPMILLLSNLQFEKVELAYYGKTIRALRQPVTMYQRILSKIRHVLLARNILFPFAAKSGGLENINDPLQRAAVKPFQAQVEQQEPSWWLRALAVKK